MCLSICPPVHQSVRLLEYFEQGNQLIITKFSEHPNSLEVIFWWVIQTPKPTGSGLDMGKGGFYQIYHLPRFEVRGDHTFLRMGHLGKKMFGAEF